MPASPAPPAAPAAPGGREEAAQLGAASQTRGSLGSRGVGRDQGPSRAARGRGCATGARGPVRTPEATAQPPERRERRERRCVRRPP